MTYSPKDRGRYEIHLGDRPQLGAVEGEAAELNKQNIEIEKNYMKSIQLTEVGKGNWVIAKSPWETLTTVIHKQTTVQDLRTVAHWLRNYPSESYGVYGKVTSSQDLIGLLNAVWEELRHLEPASFISREDRDKAIHIVRMARDRDYMIGEVLKSVIDTDILVTVKKILYTETNESDRRSLKESEVRAMIDRVVVERDKERIRQEMLGSF